MKPCLTLMCLALIVTSAPIASAPLRVTRPSSSPFPSQSSPPTHSASANPHIIGNPSAPLGGTLVVGYPYYPKHLIHYLAFDQLAEGINELVLESLLERDLQTGEWLPALAKSWSESPDHRQFTFEINSAARFSDGTPVTAEDVKFTWDTITSEKNKTVPFQASFHSIQLCEILDARRVRFQVGTAHFKNFDKLAGLAILPRHIYGSADFNTSFPRTLVGSGPYRLTEATPGERIVLEKAPQYWGASRPQNIGRYAFKKIIFRIVSDPQVQFELLKRGEIDYFYFLVSKTWARDTSSALFQKGFIRKIRAENKVEYGTSGIALNLRRPLFADKKVRRALAHLFPRTRIIKDLLYESYVPATGIVSRSSPFHSSKNRPIAFDESKARVLLKEAGWTPSPSDSVLTKGNLRFEFELLLENSAMERVMTVYQEELKKSGIRMTLKMVDWGTRLKLVDERKFDATPLYRSREEDPSDFGGTWGSRWANVPSSENLTGYQNPEVDSLAEKIDREFDRNRRIAMVRKLDSLISEDQPVIFDWEPSSFRIAHWDKFGYPGIGYFAFSDWRNTFHYWWLDPTKSATNLRQQAAVTVNR